MADQLPLDQIQVDQQNLYREESITDLRVATIRRLIPINTDGTDDTSRPTQYIGSTQIISQMGPLPISAPIEAASLQEAIEKFPQAIKHAVDQMVEEAKEYRRQESSRIVVPGTMPGGLPGQGGVPGGGNPPGGGIISS
ncbi:MAG: hypothetical protein OXI94_14210 [Gemmatimonadota bacterium]|nr:hypothetical protein [Gemmatimonadota bacterium]MDE2831690.1 hypothetical protein [Gemmatimonadota bacterium]MDE2954150.1 hypothetical protein [Gemmatimonadota bacterium]